VAAKIRRVPTRVPRGWGGRRVGRTSKIFRAFGGAGDWPKRVVGKRCSPLGQISATPRRFGRGPTENENELLPAPALGRSRGAPLFGRGGNRGGELVYVEPKNKTQGAGPRRICSGVSPTGKKGETPTKKTPTPNYRAMSKELTGGRGGPEGPVSPVRPHRGLPGAAPGVSAG